MMDKEKQEKIIAGIFFAILVISAGALIIYALVTR